MNLSKLMWSPLRPETANASAAVRKLALPLQKSFATLSGVKRTRDELPEMSADETHGRHWNSKLLSGRSEYDFVDVNLLRLTDRERHRARE
jgi:hypothetical protein